jgi:hypothetical protein
MIYIIIFTIIKQAIQLLRVTGISAVDCGLLTVDLVRGGSK